MCVQPRQRFQTGRHNIKQNRTFLFKNVCCDCEPNPPEQCPEACKMTADGNTQVETTDVCDPASGCTTEQLEHKTSFTCSELSQVGSCCKAVHRTHIVFAEPLSILSAHIMTQMSFRVRAQCASANALLITTLVQTCVKPRTQMATLLCSSLLTTA